ncbi:MAG: hypothetical protein Q7S62_01185 [bacterium]|nr:hypothetical protein [bacterium]
MKKQDMQKYAKALKRGHLASLSVDDIVELIKRADGKCYLCEEKIDLDNIGKIDGDKKNSNGPLSVENLYLTHKKCNIQKSNEPVSIVKAKLAFSRFYEKKDSVSFNDFLDEYVPNNRKTVRFKITNDIAYLKFGEDEKNTPIFTDPATKIQYFFYELPMDYIYNDDEVQPRPIDKSHLFKMMADFQIHPVHEPSDCRIVDNSRIDGNYKEAKLLQFDGQHKSAAQILIGRTKLQFKIYIAPSIKLIRELVIIIQNEIKKKAVLESIVIKRMSASYMDRWNEYIESPGEHSEAGLIESLPNQEKKLAKKELMNAVYSNIIDNKELELKEFVTTGQTRSEKNRPISINLLKQIINNFVYSKPNDVPVGEKDSREIEAENTTKFLNIISEAIFGELTPIQRNRQDLPEKILRIWKSGSVKFWANILKNLISHRLNIIAEDDKERIFQRKLTANDWDGIGKTVNRLFSHSVWGKIDQNLDKILNSNDLKAATRELAKKGLDTDFLIK